LRADKNGLVEFQITTVDEWLDGVRKLPQNGQTFEAIPIETLSKTTEMNY
jgi:hypothetical protein